MNNAWTSPKDATLLDLLDRLLDRGVVLAGDLTISVADVDLISLRLGVLLASIECMTTSPRNALGDPAAAHQSELPIGWPAPREIA